ncbi:DUF2500 domain-containing protein [Anaerotignum sp.]
MGYGMNYGFGFGAFEAMFTIVFVLVIGIFIFNIVRGIGQWNSNNQSPRLTVNAVVVSKRNHVSYHHHADDHAHHASHTTYYVTFQVESGDRMELSMSGQEFGMLAEGDRGSLSFQGTRYLGFQRTESKF